MTKRLTSASKANAAALLAEAEDLRAKEAYELRRRGMPWWEIADRLNMSEAAVKNSVTSRIELAADMVGAHMKRQLLVMEVDRLDALMAAHWERATETRTVTDAEGNSRTVFPDLDAAKYVADIVMKRAKLLGLDDMAQVNVTQQTVVVGGTSEEYIAALRLISGGRRVEGEVVDGGAA